MNAYKKVRALVGDKNIAEHVSNIIIDKLDLKYVSKSNKLQLNKYINFILLSIRSFVNIFYL